MDIHWTLEKRKISELKENPNNPRQIRRDQTKGLKDCIDKFGLIDKPIINTDGMLIGGHQRKRILEKRGCREIECWVPSRFLSMKEVEELTIRLNKNTGEWDFDILGNIYDIGDLVDWGFSLDELDGFIAGFGEICHEEEMKDEKPDKPGRCPTCGQKLKKQLEGIFDVKT